MLDKKHITCIQPEDEVSKSSGKMSENTPKLDIDVGDVGVKPLNESIPENVSEPPKETPDSDDPVPEDKKEANEDKKEAVNETEDKKEGAAEPKKRKLVGFAPEPQEDLKEHHQYLDDRKKEKLKSNPFWKIPPELAYLDHKPEGPRPLPLELPLPEPKKVIPFSEMRDRRCVAVKDISVVNKQTELNFNYWETPNPCSSYCVIVDIKYVSLTSFDISKLSKYLVNLSNSKIGLGYDFVGKIIRPGSRFEGSEFTPGTTVFGILDPQSRKGSLLSAQVITPGKDILIAVPDEVLTQLSSVDVCLDFGPSETFAIEADTEDSDQQDLATPTSEPPKSDNTQEATKEVKEPVEVPNLAKLTVFGSSYCRARLALLLMDLVFSRQTQLNILINGGDTHLGYTILQTLFSSVYADIIDSLNVILVVKESSLPKMKNLVEKIGNAGSRRIQLVAFDMVNEDLILPGEKVPVNYKKVSFFASEIVDAMFAIFPHNELIDVKNVDRCKIDLFIDIVGSKKMFQLAMSMSSLDKVNFPLKERLSPGVKLTTIFGKSKGPLFEKIMKPKAEGCSFVSFCKFNLSEPSYLITELVDFTSKDIFNPWGLKWLQGLANQFVARYNYYEKLDLEVKKSWVEEGLRLVAKGELKFAIDEVVDWRHQFKKHVNALKARDGHVVFEIETF